jgi:hypothetical protein
VPGKEKEEEGRDIDVNAVSGEKTLRDLGFRALDALVAAPLRG